jgi:hypothetical protein
LLFATGVSVTIWAIADIACAIRDTIKDTFDQTASEGKDGSGSRGSSSINDSSSTGDQSKWKDLVLVFQRMDEALRFVQTVSSVSAKNNGQWFIDTILCPGNGIYPESDGSSLRSGRSDEESISNRPTNMSEYEDCKEYPSESGPSRPHVSIQKASLGSISVHPGKARTSIVVAKKGHMWKLKMSGKVLKVWRYRKFELHRGEAGHAGTLMYQSENPTTGKFRGGLDIGACKIYG